MTEEELKAKLAELENEKEALKRKNSELIDREKKAKAAADAAEEAAESAAAEAAAKAGDVEAIKASLQKKHDAALKKVEAERDAANAQLQTLLVDNGLQAALVAGNVDPEHFDILIPALKAQVTMKDGAAYYGDEPLTDGVTAFLTGKGAKYCLAPANSGAGATGSSAKATGWSKPPATAEEYDRYFKLTVSDPAQASALADSWGMPELKPV
ncbi:hypothetical protein JQK15_13580 [Sphingobium sp. BHU LFT2]|uniref:hypothetical protein n=1 Tax=Sphingobium sp. BHU LFT2 TaxID=2807634 RepID=UPI001BE64CBE|nr:hypothetical protein [Sphingobium sp. BHU LFT2]MBT2244570.1 hypothetical protein [Sphingobium sp. BHU LFT2]